MKTKLISDDPENGSFSTQLRWCSNNGFHGSGQGPEIEVDPAFPRREFIEKVKANGGKLPKIRLSACLKFGGVCSSKHCRDEHEKLLLR